jgi:hypothetical protein
MKLLSVGFIFVIQAHEVPMPKPPPSLRTLTIRRIPPIFPGKRQYLELILAQWQVSWMEDVGEDQIKQVQEWLQGQ